MRFQLTLPRISLLFRGRFIRTVFQNQRLCFWSTNVLRLLPFVRPKFPWRRRTQTLTVMVSSSPVKKSLFAARSLMNATVLVIPRTLLTPSQKPRQSVVVLTGPKLTKVQARKRLGLGKTSVLVPTVQRTGRGVMRLPKLVNRRSGLTRTHRLVLPTGSVKFRWRKFTVKFREDSFYVGWNN